MTTIHAQSVRLDLAALGPILQPYLIAGFPGMKGNLAELAG